MDQLLKLLNKRDFYGMDTCKKGAVCSQSKYIIGGMKREGK